MMTNETLLDFARGMLQGKKRMPVTAVHIVGEGPTCNPRGYTQATNALDHGLRGLGVRSVQVVPFVEHKEVEAYRAFARNTANRWIDLELPGREKPVRLVIGEVVNKEGDPVICIAHGTNATYFADGLTAYDERKNQVIGAVAQNNLFPVSENLTTYKGGVITEAALVFSRACVQIAEAIRLASAETVIVHGHDHLAALAILLAKAARFKTVLTVHNPAYTTLMPNEAAALWGIEGLDPGKTEQIDLLSRAMRLAGRVTTVSPTYANELNNSHFEYGPTEEQYGKIAAYRNISGILNALPPSLLSDKGFAPLLLQGNQPFRFLFSNRLVGQKGYDKFLAGYSSYKMIREISENPETNFDFTVLAEQGIADPEIAQAFAAAGLKSEEYSQHAMLQAMSRSHVGLMPSEFEPCGMFAMACQANGVFPLAALVGGLNDVLGKSLSGEQYGYVRAISSLAGNKVEAHPFGFSFLHSAYIKCNDRPGYYSPLNSVNFWKGVFKLSAMERNENGRSLLEAMRSVMIMHARNAYAPSVMAEKYLKLYEELAGEK